MFEDQCIKSCYIGLNYIHKMLRLNASKWHTSLSQLPVTLCNIHASCTLQKFIARPIHRRRLYTPSLHWTDFRHVQQRITILPSKCNITLVQSIYGKKYSNLTEIATKGFMLVSCTIRCGEQHIKSWTVLNSGKLCKMTSKNKMVVYWLDYTVLNTKWRAMTLAALCYLDSDAISRQQHTQYSNILTSITIQSAAVADLYRSLILSPLKLKNNFIQ